MAQHAGRIVQRLLRTVGRLDTRKETEMASLVTRQAKTHIYRLVEHMCFVDGIEELNSLKERALAEIQNHPAREHHVREELAKLIDDGYADGLSCINK